MIAVNTLSRKQERRSAFTLLEVLVVVAILVVLASVAGIAVFKYLDDAKEDKARMDMQAFLSIYNGEVARSGGELTPDQLDPQRHIAPKLDKGMQSFIDPWGNPYQWRSLPGQNGDPRIQFYTVNTKNGNEIFWPLN